MYRYDESLDRLQEMQKEGDAVYKLEAFDFGRCVFKRNRGKETFPAKRKARIEKRAVRTSRHSEKDEGAARVASPALNPHPPTHSRHMHAPTHPPTHPSRTSTRTCNTLPHNPSAHAVEREYRVRPRRSPPLPPVRAPTPTHCSPTPAPTPTSPPTHAPAFTYAPYASFPTLRRMAVEREYRAALDAPPANVLFDETGRVLIYSSVVGIKVRGIE